MQPEPATADPRERRRLVALWTAVVLVDSGQRGALIQLAPRRRMSYRRHQVPIPSEGSTWNLRGTASLKR